MLIVLICTNVHQFDVFSCVQTTSGMIYLEQQRIIHRDLGARNLLISSSSQKQYLVKVSDFGLSKLLNEEFCYTSASGNIPIRWSPPGLINFGYSLPFFKRCYEIMYFHMHLVTCTRLSHI